MRIAGLAASAVLLTAVSAAWPAPPPDQDPQGSLAAALEYYDQGRYERAREVLDGLIRAGGITAEVLYYRGLVEPSADTAAEKYFSEITRRFSSSEFADRARFQIAHMRYATGYYLTARRLYGDVAWRQGDSALGQASRYWRAMTWTHEQPGGGAPSADSLRVAIRLVKEVAGSATDPHVRGKALVSAGELSLRMGQPDSAMVFAAEVLAAPYLGDYHARALAMQAQVYDSKGQAAAARDSYQILLRAYPDTWEGSLAERWMLQQRELTAQARLDSMRSGGDQRFSPGSGEGRWTIQVGAFSDLANASRLVMELTARDQAAWHDTKRVDGRVLVAVYVGRFGTRTEAEAFALRLREAGIITEHTTVQIP